MFFIYKIFTTKFHFSVSKTNFENAFPKLNESNVPNSLLFVTCILLILPNNTLKQNKEYHLFYRNLRFF